MFSIRVTEPDGSCRTVPLSGRTATVGRHADNTISLQGPGISGRHCQFEIVGGVITLQDRGSTNGTFVRNQRLEGPLQVGEGVEVWVGSVKLEVVAMAPSPSGMVAHGIAPRPVATTGPLLVLQQGADRRWRDMHGRLTRIADAWEAAGRPDKLALRRAELAAARRWLTQPEDRGQPVTRLQRELIEASAGAVSRGTAKLVLLAVAAFVVVAGGAAAAIIFWPASVDVPPVPTSDGGSTSDDNDDDEDDDDGPAPRRMPKVSALEPVVHTVVPEETLEDIARRYDVTSQEIADWNAISKDDPIREGDTLKIDRPKASPLPQQRITYEVEVGEDSWTTLAERFDISPARLRGYNETDYPHGPVVGKAIKVWIDPKPYRRSKNALPIPPISAREDAIARGYPNSGSLENGIQMPDSTNYIRRYPRLMWGGAYLVSNLQRAVAAFRRDIAWEGELVLADISKQRGGLFPPHASHQAGRDIDIWLPTLRGVFKAKYLTDTGDTEWGRRPQPEEVDWFATFGFIEALAETGAVQEVFLDKTLHPTLRRAGLEMGATEEEADAIFKRNGGVVAHSPAHIHHIHVRFKCAPYEKPGCHPNATHGQGGE